MALHGCMRCLKYIVFIFNFVVWLAGMGVLGLAIWLRMDPKVNHYVRAAYGVEQLNVYYVLCYVLMCVGGVMTFVGFLGCCGAFQESKCMLATFFAFLFLILGAQLGGTVWAFIHKVQMENSVTGTFQDLIHNWYGTIKDPVIDPPRDYELRVVIDEAIDYVQRTRHCCGGKGPEDWQQATWVQHDINKQKKVPGSCCIPLTLNQPASKSCIFGDPRQPVYETRWESNRFIILMLYCLGCGEQMIMFFRENLLIIAAVGLGIGGIEIFGMIFSLCLCCAMRRSRGGGYKS